MHEILSSTCAVNPLSYHYMSLHTVVLHVAVQVTGPHFSLSVVNLDVSNFLLVNPPLSIGTYGGPTS